MGWWSRLRHERGFGVHSPFAYRFITECLNDLTPYYDYARMPSTRDRLLYRIAVLFQPSEIVSIGNADARAAKMACPPKGGQARVPARMAGVPRTRLLVCNGAPKQLSDGDIAFIECSNREAISDTFALMKHGMLFTDEKTMAVAVCLYRLPRQQFSLNFKS